MRFVIVTGMSGAGKTAALKMLEDIGFFCADNLPVPLIDKFMMLSATSSQEYSKVALGVDVRSIRRSEDILEVLDRMKGQGYSFEILFLDAEDTALIRRYKETRRRHPLAKNERVDVGITRERELLYSLRQRADYIIDTTQLLPRDLRTEINRIFVQQESYRNLFVSVLSFGFKYGIPADADLVFDVRFLPNPYYVEQLKHHTGNEPQVQAYVEQGNLSGEFKKKWFDLIDFLLPNYAAEGKNQLVIAVGCTGGKHRSVTMANRLYEHLLSQKAYGVRIEHRDILK